MELFSVKFESIMNGRIVDSAEGVVLRKLEENGDISFYGMDSSYKYRTKLIKQEAAIAYTTTNVVVERYEDSIQKSIIGDADKFELTRLAGGAQ